MGRIRRGTLVAALLVPAVAAVLVVTTLSRADDRTKDVQVPSAWSAVWQRSHTLEGEDVVLAWGDLAGEDPRNAPSELRFDPAAVLADLDALYALDVRDLQVADERGPAGRHKIVVLADGTWSGTVPDRPGGAETGGVSAQGRTATGVVEDGVGLVRAEVSALRGVSTASWDLARGFAETVLGFAADGGQGFAADADDPFWAASAAFLATASSDSGIGDPSDLVRSPSLPWSSARSGDGGWLLLQYLADRDGGDLLGRLWRGARDGESPIETYRRLTKIDQASLNRRVAEYALRTLTWDFTHQGQILDGVAGLDPVLVAGRSTPVTAVADDPGRYQVLDGFAPSDYGFNLVRLVPDAPMSTIHVRLRGHPGAPDAGWSLGLVALRDGIPRYSPVVEGQDEEVQFALRDGEDEAYLVVVGTPSVTHTPSGGGFGSAARYPYEFRVAGATVSTSGAAEPVEGGHPHANGGGWVDDDATVDDTAYVGPYAVVRGDAQVHGTARIEGAAWVGDGAVVEGQAVVRDMAVVRSGARLGGTVVVGGDAVVDFACAAGTYATFAPARVCDGLAGPADVNAAVTPFAATDLAFGDPMVVSVDPPAPTDPSAPTTGPGGTPGSPTGAGTPRPGATPTTAPTSGPVVTSTPSPTSGVVEPPEPVPAGACSATYVVTNTWPAGDGSTAFQAQLEVTAGSGGVQGWAVSWQLPAGQQVTAVWNAQLGTSGSTVTAENMSYNGTLRSGEKAVFGLQGAGPEAVARNVAQLTCTRTR
ncbi:hypothetical protein Cch01nite_29730 [Cellulomonas chitinilytica]|uniref:CBM2 domain-containing protein n=1 Tax=Cellulomonas chitinilytica TaxID=398759 RepID=A0A919P6I3_9CELL|nr:DUF6055 domain-containing protein [Cellulomonas chitinilytica]GIG22249.1 hypothetical protein Cch01nite_29730 [Cellulomonas chitinilytica]